MATFNFFLDIQLVQAKLGPPIDGASPVDMTLKSVARIITNLPHALVVMQTIPVLAQFSFLPLQTVIMTGALIQNGRLYLDIPNGAIYSV